MCAGDVECRTGTDRHFSTHKGPEFHAQCHKHKKEERRGLMESKMSTMSVCVITVSARNMLALTVVSLTKTTVLLGNQCDSLPPLQPLLQSSIPQGKKPDSKCICGPSDEGSVQCYEIEYC